MRSFVEDGPGQGPVQLTAAARGGHTAFTAGPPRTGAWAAGRIPRLPSRA